MNEKINNLIDNLSKIHNKIINKYKNIELIQGQYDIKIKTMSKVLREQTQHKVDVYHDMLSNASKVEIDISDQGHQEVLELSKKSEESINECMAKIDSNILETAEEFSKIKIELFTSILDIMNKYEVEKDIKHEVLKEQVILIIEMETKDHQTLLSFKPMKEIE